MGLRVASVTAAFGLLGMNYHFVRDLIAGGFVGGMVGAYLAHNAGLGETQRPAPRSVDPA